jgi:ATP-dependent Clp protease ATP-binding subunit ClpA
VLIEGLASGFITDARGKRIYLSDTVTLLTVPLDLRPGGPRRRLGFLGGQEDTKAGEDLRKIAVRAFGNGLVEQVDLICAKAPEAGEGRRRWLEQNLLADLASRYARQGLQLEWDASLVTHLVEESARLEGQRDWERYVDQRLAPALVPCLPEEIGGEPRVARVSWDGGAVRVEIRGAERPAMPPAAANSLS